VIDFWSVCVLSLAEVVKFNCVELFTVYVLYCYCIEFLLHFVTLRNVDCTAVDMQHFRYFMIFSATE